MSIDTIAVKKISEDAKLPTKSYSGDLGYDLYSIEEVENTDSVNKKLFKIRTGICVKLPDHFGAFIKERSSMGAKGIEIRGGVIDRGYTGEIVVIAELPINTKISKGDKIAQLVPIFVTDFKILSVDDLSQTDRGNRGFGSSGI
jgi:dUTP pyrophosphatase